MMNIVLLILIIVGIITFEVPGMIKAKARRELIAFSILLLIGSIYSFGYVLDIKTPNPTKYIERVFAPPAKFIESLLK